MSMALQEVDYRLTSKDWHVRTSVAGDSDITPTAECVDRGMQDISVNVRRAWAQRRDFTPTPKQVEAGLADKDWMVHSYS